MTTTAHTHPVTAWDQVVRLNVSRSVYDALVEGLGDDGHIRLTYDGEVLEIMSPGPLHEIVSRVVSGLLEVASLEWDLDLTDLGSTRFKPPGGQEFEADGAWYIDMETRINDRRNIDLAVDPPPDILLETDITTESSDKLTLFARIRVPEVWLYKLDGFTAKALERGEYVTIETSRAIAGLPIAEIAKRLEAEAIRSKSNTLLFRREWQQWLRANRHLHDGELGISNQES